VRTCITIITITINLWRARSSSYTVVCRLNRFRSMW